MVGSIFIKVTGSQNYLIKIPLSELYIVFYKHQAANF